MISLGFGRQNYDQVLIAFGERRIGKKFEVNCRRAAPEACKAKSTLDNNSAFALEPRKRTEKFWPVAGPSKFTLTSCQQSDVLRV
jgi:hypothetical protein